MDTLLVNIIAWTLFALIFAGFFYGLILEGTMRTIIYWVTVTFWVAIAIIFISIIIAWAIGTFDSGSIFTVNIWGLNMFFVKFGILAGLIISMIVYVILGIALFFGFKAVGKKSKAKFTNFTNDTKDIEWTQIDSQL